MAQPRPSERSPAEQFSAVLDRSPGFVKRLLALPAVARSVRTLVVVAGGLRADPLTLRAASLTYLTVLSLVPLLAVVFSLFQAVVGKRNLQAQLTAFLVDNLAVGIRESTQRVVEQHLMKSGLAVGGVGFLFLLASAVSLLANIESAFNHIFHAPRRRPWHLRLGLYWCLLTLGPLLLGLSVGGTALLGSSRELGALRPLAGLVLPLLITYGAFSLLYWLVPAVPVKRRAALVGALVAGTAWEAAKLVYAAWSARSVKANAIYGSLSAIPTFLLWTYLSWMVVLFGARIAYAAQATHLGWPNGADGAPLMRELATARVMAGVALAFRDRGGAPDEGALAVRLHIDEAVVAGALRALAAAGLVRHLEEGGWVPARSPQTISLAEVRAAARGALPDINGNLLPVAPGLESIAQLWREADAAADGVLSGISCEEVLARTVQGKVQEF